ncbi:hypothetical protein O7630_19060 [Micromonospora sp. WMMD718]|uniref:hypothetical protein n=1 Tax=Micromonospora sp. WMMD718 TaxID=3016098 RepID=UPI0024165729|nr:hypothetical protein [Micromonospora sp. WMMD718]MDG4753045.1 hypothetical protein [Micromonospora sp. WMMD718]
MSNDVTTPDGGAPMAPPPRTSKRRALWVATGVAGLTGVVGLAALGGLAARDDKSGTEPVAENHAAAPQNASDDSRAEGGKGGEKGEDGYGKGGRDRGEWGPDKGEWGKDGKDDHGKTREVPCKDDALIDALELANRDHGGTIKLAENCTYELGVKDRKFGSALPEIKQDVTIKGNNSTIKRDAEDTFRIFRVVDGGDLTLKDLTVKGGNANEFKYPGGGRPAPTALVPDGKDDDKRFEGDGGALLVERGGSAHLSNVKLVDNNAEGDGGAIANYGRTWLKESKVVGNHAQGDGGGVYNEGILKVEETHVDDNTAGGNGGGIANGGGEHHDGPVDLTSAAKPGKGDKGEHGKHHAGTVEIIGAHEGKDASLSTLSHNRAGHNGGGLFSSGGWVTVSFTAIGGNVACENGGGVYAENTDLLLEKVHVAGNHADGDGGGVVTTGGRDWAGNGAEKDGLAGSATIADSAVVDNTAGRFGGGIFNGEWLVKIEDGFIVRDHDKDDNATLTIRDTDIKGNTALNGGGIFNNKAKITLTKTHVTKNTATDSSKLHRVAGGVLNNEGRVKLDDKSLISNNDPTNCANTVEDCFN